MSKWRRATISIILGGILVFIVYDIIVVTNSENDTISNVTMTAIYRFPFIAYAFFVIGGHFLSLKRTRKRYIKALVGISVAVVLASIIMLLVKLTGNTAILSISSVLGFCTGMFCWSQRRLKN